MDPEVIDAMAQAMRDCFGNPSSLHPPGVAAHRMLERARLLLSGMLGARSLVFTGGGTEASNLAIRGITRKDAGKKDAGRILFGRADHPATTATITDLATDGFTPVALPVHASGQLDLEALEQELRQEAAAPVRLISLLYGHNELGTLSDIEGAIALVREHAPRAHVHVDIVQAFAKAPFDLDRMGADSATIAAHKIHGPKGLGALALGAKAHPKAFVTGGGQESGLRSGTENVPGAHAFARAAELWVSRMDEESGRIRRMRDDCESRLRSAIPQLRVLGDPERRLPHLLPITLPGLVGEVLLHHLDEHGIYVSTGSACSQHDKKKSGEEFGLEAIGVPGEELRGMLRISFGRLNQEQDVDAICRALPEIVQSLQPLRP